MARIKITPEEMDKASNQFRQAQQESEQLTQKLNSLMQSMQPEWEGMQSNAFYVRYQENQKEMKSYIEMLGFVSEELTRIAKRFREADQT
ncbi:WXG100 family type VII secretion target [Paenibacillus silvae]|uniref:WXG100 family type VII secretion target n=1 Tax=Paenibacillus silvae TaxID=1325358 RepID=UPI003CF984AC